MVILKSIRDNSQIDFFTQSVLFGHLGVGGFAGGCFKKKSVKNRFLTKQVFLI